MKIIWADLNKYDDESRLILTTTGTRQDLEKYRITLTNGMRLTFYMDDEDKNGNEDNLIFDGIVRYDEQNRRWVAIINWDNFKHMSDLSKSEQKNLGICD